MGTSTQLRVAVEQMDEDSVRATIAAGADLNQPLDNKSIPLTKAVFSPQMLNLLIDLGADVNGESPPDGCTALCVAATKGESASVRLLLSRGADVDKGVFSPLFMATQFDSPGHSESVSQLIAAGANVNQAMGSSVLMNASESGSETMVEELLRAGAEVNAVLDNGTALHAAIEGKRPNIVALLLKHGANPSTRAPNEGIMEGMTPIELAKKLKLKRIIAILQAKGAPTESRKEMTWAAFLSRMRSLSPTTLVSLRNGASLERLEALTSLVGTALPTEFAEYLRRTDGQTEDASTIISSNSDASYKNGETLLPVDSIIATSKMLTQLFRDGEFEGLSVSCDPEVQSVYWSPFWIPFAGDGQGNFTCLDLSPTAAGKVGQVISFAHDLPRRRCLASSFSEWLADLADVLTQSVVTVHSPV